MPSAATSTVGNFFGHDGMFDGVAVEITRASGRSRTDAVARGRLTIFGEIGFQQIALRLGVALERAQLHVLHIVARMPAA